MSYLVQVVSHRAVTVERVVRYVAVKIESMVDYFTVKMNISQFTLFYNAPVAITCPNRAGYCNRHIVKRC